MHDACAAVRLGREQDGDFWSSSFNSTLSESPASDKRLKKGREYSRHSERKQTDVTLRTFVIITRLSRKAVHI